MELPVVLQVPWDCTLHDLLRCLTPLPTGTVEPGAQVEGTATARHVYRSRALGSQFGIVQL